MPLNTTMPDFPFYRYQQLRQASLPGQVAGDALAGINIPDLINIYRNEKAKTTLANALSAMRTGTMPQDMGTPDATGGVASGPNQNYTPQTPPMAQPNTQSSMGAFSPEVAQALITSNPEMAQKIIGEQFDPFKQTEMAYKTQQMAESKTNMAKTAAETSSLPELRRSQIAKNNAEAARALREKAAILPKLEAGDAQFIKNINDKVSKNTPFTDAEIARAKDAWGVTLSNQAHLGGIYHTPNAGGVSGLTASAREARKNLGF